MLFNLLTVYNEKINVEISSNNIMPIIKEMLVLILEAIMPFLSFGENSEPVGQLKLIVLSQRITR